MRSTLEIPMLRNGNGMADRFVATFSDDGGASIQLLREKTARWPQKPQLAPVATIEWATSTMAAAAIPLLDLAARGDANDEGQSVVLSPDALARLDEAQALSIGLPPAAPLVLQLDSQGLIVDNDFRILHRWQRSSGQGVAVTIRGAHAMVGGKDYRLPQPLFGLVGAAEAVNSAEVLPARQAAFAELRLQLAGHDEHVAVDGWLRTTRVAFAGNFSLSLRGDDFDPVLFSPALGFAANDGMVPDEGEDSVLSPDQQADFARQFRAGGGRRSAWLLRDGLLLFTDPGLAKALTVVGEKQRAPAAERRLFASSPRRAIAEALGPDAAPDLEALFIETSQYSERVIGIDPWRKPVLPWIKPRPNSWLPDRFGLMVGEGDAQQRLEIAPADVGEVLARIETAAANGDTEVRIGDVLVPATPATITALKDLAQLVSAAPKDDQKTDAPSSVADKYFLQINDNLEDLVYAPLTQAKAVPSAPAKVPGSVTTTLKAHQIDGFRWLADAWRSGRPGVLLADDMGLGKTLQTLAFLCWLRQEGVSQPFLIVAPTGLLANWREEISRHLVPGALGEIVSAYGFSLAAMRTGRGTDVASGSAQLDVQGWASAGIVLTTYETLRDYHVSLARSDFAVVAFDEAQRIKNPAAQITRAAKTMRARFNVALTGTPVENRLQDLWSITDVVHPGLLGSSKDFEGTYGTADIETLKTLNTRLTVAAAPWPPFMLRRMKADHVEGLPAKRLNECVETMPPMQANAYAAAVNRALALRDSSDSVAILETLARLRSVSLCPVLPQPGPNFENNSARLKACFTVLADIHKRGEKALIFCEALALQPLLAAEIRRRFGLSHPVSCISGEVAGDQRQRLVSQFQNRPLGFDVMILSPRAGGVGLTITAANHVIHLTRWWNPAVEDQATDRVYRIGQTRDVDVWVPIAEHPDPSLSAASFDRKLADLLARKRNLAQGLLIEPEAAGDAEDLLGAVLSAEPPIEVALETTIDQPAAPEREAPPPIAADPLSEPEPAPPPVAPIPPTVAPALTPPQIPPFRRQRILAGSTPSLGIFLEALVPAGPALLTIEDPYVAGSRASCRAFAEFLAGLAAGGAKIERVALTCFDNDSIETPFVSQQQQSQTLAEAIAHYQLQNLRFYPDFVSRRVNRLHDRWIEARLASGRKIYWDIGRGIDGFMSPRHDCIVTRTIDIG